MLGKTFLLAPAIALVALVTWSTGGATQTGDVRQCKSRPLTGIAITRDAAVRDWRRMVERRHGGQWAEWPLARSPMIECTGGRHGGPGMPTCRASALPCRV